MARWRHAVELAMTDEAIGKLTEISRSRTEAASRVARAQMLLKYAEKPLFYAATFARDHDEPKFSELFMAGLLSRNSRIEEDLIDQLFNSSEKRLARVLLLLANFGKDDAPEPIVGKFSQEILAEMIGTTRSRVSYFMNKFRTLGYIRYNGKLEIHNSLLNVVLYDKPISGRRTRTTG